jgi:hypothetical protein
MATENELQQAMADFREATQGMKEAADYGKVNLRGFGEELLGSAKTVKKAREDFGKNLAVASKQAVNAMGSLAANLSKGQSNFTQLNTVVDIAANALSGMAKAIPFAGEALAAGIQATAAASKFMLDQMDQTAQSFNKLGAVGALTEKGMSGLQKQFITSNLSFAAFNKQVTENAQALARFKGMAGDGADAFSEITGKLADLSEGSDDSLRRLGMSTDEIGASTAAFITQQTRLGQAQGKSNQELAAGAKAYAIELDALQKVTGMSREAIQKQQDAALSESRFRANYDELISQGKEKEAKQLMQLQTQYSAMSQEAGQGIRDLLSGAGTDASKKLMASTGGAAQDILDRVKNGSLSSSEAAIEMQKAMKGTAAAAMNNAKYVDKANSAYLDYSQQSDIVNAKLVNGQLVKERQDKQMTKGQDELTDQTVDAQKAMQSMGIEMQKLGFTFLPDAAKATAAMTKSMAKFVKFVNEKIGGHTEDEDTEKTRKESNKESLDKAKNTSTEAGSREEGRQSLENANALKNLNRERRKQGMAPLTSMPGGGGGGGGGSAPQMDGGEKNAGQDHPQGPASASSEGSAGPNEKGVKPDVLSKKASLEALIGKKLTVTSGFRQGAANHGSGDAIDLGFGANKLSAADTNKLIKGAIDLGFTGIGAEFHAPGGAHLHFDTSHAGLVGWGSDYTSKSLGSDSPYAEALINARRSGRADPEMSAANGGILSGPIGGYKPNLTMHGTEAIVPLNTAAQQAAAGGGEMGSDIMAAQLDKMDEMISILKNQLGVSTKIMQYSS